MSTTLRPEVQTDPEPRWGRDVTGALHLLVDPEGRVRDVRLDHLPEELRNTMALEAAVRAAIADVDWQHLRAVSDEQGRGASQHGEITVVLGMADGLRTMTTDADWLRETTAPVLRSALREAFTAAAGASDPQA